MNSFLLLAGNISVSAIIDIVALCLILIFFIIGIVRGFAKTFLSIFGRLIALLLAVLLCSSMAGFLNKTFDLTNKIAVGLDDIVGKIFGETFANTTIEQINETSIQNFSISNFIAKIILDAKNVGDLPPTTTISQIISPALSFYVVSIISAVILYILFRIVLFIIGDIIKKATQIKLIGALDKFLGAILGFVWGVVMVQIVIVLFNAIPLEFCQKICAEISNTTITKFINKINVYAIIMNSISKADIIPVIKNFVLK